MSAVRSDRDRALRLYSVLLALYPRALRDEFGPQLQRTFEDLYRDATAGERRAGLGFWLAVAWTEGGSILREHAARDTLIFVLLLAWAVGVLVVPTTAMGDDWRNFVVPAVLLGAMLIAIPGMRGMGHRLATLALLVAVVGYIAWQAPSIQDDSHLLAPALFLACCVLSMKTLASLDARIRGGADALWSVEEIVYGAAVGVVGIAGIALAVAHYQDDSSAAPIFLLIGVPIVCGVAGFRSSRRNPSVRWGINAALGSLLLGAMIWILAEPLLAQAALKTVLRDHPVPVATTLIYWKGFGGVVFWAAMIGMVGALFGQLTKENGRGPQST